MRIAVANTQSPFIHGGAETLAAGLITALREAGHCAELVTLPFRFHPPSEVLRTMETWAGERFDQFDVGHVDAVVCLRFPTYCLRHPNRIVWLLHQHRAVYDLHGTAYGGSDDDPDAIRLRRDAIALDNEHLRSARAVYTIARRVSERLREHNGIASTPIYHPPAHADRFRCADPLPYIFFPSRLEELKRQALLIRAMALVRSPVAAVLAGEGGSREKLESLITELGVGDRVRLIGRIDFDELVGWYANALGVFFGPFDEDYGYVTLEAMLSAKAVITCKDSGEPTEFVRHEETGLITEPTPAAIADAIDSLHARPTWARELGTNARDRYFEMNIRWDDITHAITGSAT